MKALFKRFNRGLNKEDDNRYSVTSANKEKLLELPPLPQWPPVERVTTTPSSFQTTKPLPDIENQQTPPPPPLISQTNSQGNTVSSRPPSAGSASALKPPVEDGSGDAQQTSSSRPESDPATRTSRKTTNGSIATSSDSQNPKKVAFISPAPTPALLLERVPTNYAASNGDALSKLAPLKTTISRLQGGHVNDTRGSTSTMTSSKVNTSGKTAKSTKTAIPPVSQKTFMDTISINQSIRSGTPYSQASQSTSRILNTASWSEAAEEDLVSNLGPRERTRQEVLWEIVASEERYVIELQKLKETFVDPLLHPYSSVTPATSPTPLDHDERPETYAYVRAETPREFVDHLPIASRFLSPAVPDSADSQSQAKDGTPNIDGESLDTDEDEAHDHIGKSYGDQQKHGRENNNLSSKFNHPRSPYNTMTRGNSSKGDKVAVPFPTRSQHSLPTQGRAAHAHTGSTSSLDRQSIRGVQERQSKASDRRGAQSATRVLRKLKRSSASHDAAARAVIAPHQLPDDLRKCLEVIEGGIYDGHVVLSGGLRSRYEEQYPLVRSLADVFVTNSYILHGYATYVLHLERALEQVDDALSTASDSKRPKNQDAAEWMKVCKLLHKLEENASEKGETGLAISLSKPFQRLLKYPLLFQNLLYHTDPSTFEYESTLQMVAEVESIVRSIEDEKIQKEERDKTRDAFARIEGLEKVKQLALPKASRLLIEERPLSTNENSNASLAPPSASKNVKGKTSFRRLSDVLQTGSSSSIGGKKDLWLVVFNDVVLRCQRTGITSLPLASTINSRTTSLPDLQVKAKYSTARRNSHAKPRNLYKFLKIETWAIGDVVQPREGVVAMEEVVKSRAQVHSGIPTGAEDHVEEDDIANDSDDSDRKSKMSFSYWGADKVTVHKPMTKGRTATGLSRRGSGAPSSYGRESSANAKFGSRLVSHGDGHPPRPASRRTQATPVSRRANHSEDGHGAAKSTVTARPAWVGSTRASSAAQKDHPTKRVRNTSGTGSVPARTSNKSLASPAPSEDSGVGLYRQLMAQESPLHQRSS